MFLKKKSNLFQTLAFRLTLWHLLLFSVLSISIFVVMYFSLVSYLKQEMDDELLDTAKEFGELYYTHGIQALKEEFQREARAEGLKRVFFLLISPEGEIEASSDLGSWHGLPIPSNFSSSLNKDAIFQTLSLTGHRHKIRILLKPIRDGHILEIGITLKNYEFLTQKYRRIFGIALITMLLCGGFAGWLVTKKAMSGVERITKIATRIGKYDLKERVPVENEGQEIDNLALAFNEMLERIEALVKELKEITDHVAHDLRSPITRIRGIAETTLLGQQDLDAYREMAATVIEEGDRLVAMINTMLEISQTDSGVIKISRETLDIRGIVREAVDLFQPVAEDKQIDLRSNLPLDPVIIAGDKAKIQRVIANLLDNALKYTEPNGIVNISVKKDQSQAVIEVVDTGMGIRQEEIPRIFERFYRGDKSRSTPGHGLGLSLALAIVRAHGGDIIVKSTVNKGSTFKVILPLATSIS